MRIDTQPGRRCRRDAGAGPAQIEGEFQRSGGTGALREGLDHMNQPKPKRKRFETTAVNPGRCYLPSLDKISEVLTFAGGGLAQATGSCCLVAMILLDANLLIYARMTTLPQHTVAKRWLDASLNGGGKVGLPWSSLLSFRIATNPRIFERPNSIASAFKQVEDWLGCPGVWVPAPGENHATILARTLDESGGGDRVMDAHLAALAIEHGLTLCSADRDFARFRALRWENPIDATRA